MKKCELCGSPVRVVGNTTLHYEPAPSVPTTGESLRTDKSLNTDSHEELARKYCEERFDTEQEAAAPYSAFLAGRRSRDGEVRGLTIAFQALQSGMRVEELEAQLSEAREEAARLRSALERIVAEEAKYHSTAVFPDFLKNLARAALVFLAFSRCAGKL